MLQSKAGYIDARPLTASSTKTSCNARPDHTFGSKADLDPPVWQVRSATKSGPLPAALRQERSLND
jgi:hypothetical protein